MTQRRSITAEMPEANYLVGNTDGPGPYYRLLMRCFYERFRSHVSYVRTDELFAFVRQYLPYEDADCRRHLDQLEKWGLITPLPEQSKPANLLELRQKPRVYQASRIALRLEEMRVEFEEGEEAAALDPAALDLLVQRVRELVTWVEQGGLERNGAAQETYRLWSAVYEAFAGFSRRIREYLDDLPRHRPREVLDYAAFLEYRDLIARYLSGYARRLFDRREQLRALLHPLAAQDELLAGALASVEVEQIRADGSRPDFGRQRERFLREIRGLLRYFGEQGDVDVLLERAQSWVTEITRHARRLSEQHLGGSIREQTLLDLARRFADAPSPAHAEALAQVAFAATLPLHWRGEAPPPTDLPAWQGEPVTVMLHSVRRGARGRQKAEATADRSNEALRRMLAATAERERAAQELAALFGPDGALDLGALTVNEPRQRQLLLRLLYKALSQQGPAGVGYRNWSVSVSVPREASLGELAGADGVAVLPHVILRLHKGGER
ncbi:MAG TPA: TIGR02677 family protein [Firmicutes bacterium]|nr:TIGR02677 family protein [Bacillota bacterium]